MSAAVPLGSGRSCCVGPRYRARKGTARAYTRDGEHVRQVVGAPLLRRRSPVPGRGAGPVGGHGCDRPAQHRQLLVSRHHQVRGHVGTGARTAHPPGYPLYTVLNAATSSIWSPSDRSRCGQPAVRGLRAAGLRRRRCRRCATSGCRVRCRPARSTTALGLLPAFWGDALVAEVYSLSRTVSDRRPGLASCVRVLWRPAGCGGSAALRPSRSPTPPRRVLLIRLLLPAVRRPRVDAEAAGAADPAADRALLALLPYATCPGGRRAGDTWLETRVFDRHSLWAAMTGAQFGDRMFEVPWPAVRSSGCRRWPGRVRAAGTRWSLSPRWGWWCSPGSVR